MYGTADIVSDVDVVNREGVSWTGSWFIGSSTYTVSSLH